MGCPRWINWEEHWCDGYASSGRRSEKTFQLFGDWRRRARRSRWRGDCTDALGETCFRSGSNEWNAFFATSFLAHYIRFEFDFLQSTRLFNYASQLWWKTPAGTKLITTWLLTWPGERISAAILWWRAASHGSRLIIASENTSWLSFVLDVVFK